MPSVSERAQTPTDYILLNGTSQLKPSVGQKLQESLSDQERIGGLTGWLARKILSAGDWIEREVEERRQTIGGIDNMWLLLTDAVDFNPVRRSPTAAASLPTHLVLGFDTGVCMHIYLAWKDIP